MNACPPLVDALREVLTVATGPVLMLADGLARIDGIESAFIAGSFAARLLGDVGAPDLPHRLPRKGHRSRCGWPRNRGGAG